MRWPWQRRKPTPVGAAAPLAIDICWGLTPWDLWHRAPHPCRHWHVAGDYGPSTYEEYWRQHWQYRHGEVPADHALTVIGRYPLP